MNDRAAGKISSLALATALFFLPRVLSAQFLETAPLPQALLSHSAVVWNGMIYIAGGVSDTGGIRGVGGFLNNVYYSAPLNADGTVGSWQVAINMPELLGLGMHASVVNDGVIYVLGGTNMFGPRQNVYHSTINQDGSLSPWGQTVSMPQRLMAHSAVALGGRIYVIAGLVRSLGSHGAVYSAPILPDKTLGQWRTELSLPVRLFGHRAVAVGSRIFVIGGSNDATLYGTEDFLPATVSADVYSATVSGDGTLGAWEKVSSLPKSLVFHAVSVSANGVYVMGGYDGSGTANSVYFSPVGVDGSLGSWQALDVLPKNLVALASIATDDYVYSLGGGLTYIDLPQENIYYLKLKSDPRAFVRINPVVLNKDANGKWVTAIVGLPEADVEKILPGTVKISAVNGAAIEPIFVDPKWTAKIYSGDAEGFEDLEGIKYAMFKFSRKALSDAVPEGEITIRIEGELSDGNKFSGENTNWIITSSARKMVRTEERSGLRKAANGGGIHVPPGAYKGNPDLSLTMETEEAASLSKEEEGNRKASSLKKGLASAGDPVKFGPAGAKFNAPVTIILPYDAGKIPAGQTEENLRVCYWNSGTKDWEELPSSVYSKEEKLIRAETSHFSVYQVMADLTPADSVPAQTFTVGKPYIFPNPVKSGKPSVHAGASAGDKLSIKIYTASGRKIHEESFSGAPGFAGGETAYEYGINASLSSGIYYYTVEIYLGGKKEERKGKFAVVR